VGGSAGDPFHIHCFKYNVLMSNVFTMNDIGIITQGIIKLSWGTTLCGNLIE